MERQRNQDNEPAKMKNKIHQLHFELVVCMTDVYFLVGKKMRFLFTAMFFLLGCNQEKAQPKPLKSRIMAFPIEPGQDRGKIYTHSPYNEEQCKEAREKGLAEGCITEQELEDLIAIVAAPYCYEGLMFAWISCAPKEEFPHLKDPNIP